MDPFASITPETFRPLTGEVFQGPEIALALVSVVDLGESGRAGGAFSLLFRGPAEPGLDQGTVLLTHPALGEIAIFLVPVGARADSRDYEAVFA